MTLAVDTSPRSRTITIPRVIVATTAMLTFISCGHAAAIILNYLHDVVHFALDEVMKDLKDGQEANLAHRIDV